MFTYIDKLRSKPEAVRRRYAFAISLVAIITIGSAWFGTYSLRMSQNGADGLGAPSPFASMKATIVDGVKNVRQNISEASPFDEEDQAENQELVATSTQSTTTHSVFGEVIITD